MAVNSSSYNYFSNVLRGLLAYWCIKLRKFLDNQFEFFPLIERNFMQPTSILARHWKEWQIRVLEIWR
jgi:hypothetical protein